MSGFSRSKSVDTRTVFLQQRLKTQEMTNLRNYTENQNKIFELLAGEGAPGRWRCQASGAIPCLSLVALMASCTAIRQSSR